MSEQAVSLTAMTSTDRPAGALFQLFAMTKTPANGYSWDLYVLSASAENSINAAIEHLAEAIVSHKCDQYSHKWSDARRSGSKLAGPERRYVLTFLGAPLNSAPNRSDDTTHLEGLVAEYLWYFSVQNRKEKLRRVKRVEPPGFLPTDPGGDGLVVYELDSGLTCFRLWEIKKDTSAAGPRSKASEIYRQLNANALSYLARYSKVRQDLEETDPALATLYAQLVELYDRQDYRMGVGAAIATSESSAINVGDCFISMPQSFSQMAKSGDQLEGMLHGVGDYSEFCRRIKEHIWTVL